MIEAEVQKFFFFDEECNKKNESLQNYGEDAS